MEKEEKENSMILIDTSVFIDHLRGYKLATDLFKDLYIREDIIFSAITEAELIAGKQCKNKFVKEEILRFIHKWKKVEVSNQVAVLAGDLCREYNTEIPDSIIAATAILNKAKVITKNVRDFTNIKELKVEAPY